RLQNEAEGHRTAGCFQHVPPETIKTFVADPVPDGVEYDQGDDEPRQTRLKNLSSGRHNGQGVPASTESTAESRSVAMNCLITSPFAPAAITASCTCFSMWTLRAMSFNSGNNLRILRISASPLFRVSERSTMAKAKCMQRALSHSEASSATITTTSKIV